MPKTTLKIPIAILFLIITFAFFYKIFSGNVPMPLDTLTGVNFPWLDYKWNYPAGIPVKNPAISDAIVQYFPWRNLVMNIWKSGQIPLWNPYTFSGTPLMANWQSAPFYPLNIIMLLLANGWGWTFIIIFQVFLSLVFTYLFLREIKLSPVSSLFGAIIFSFSGFMMIYLEYNSPSQAAIWLPLILLLIEKFCKTKSPILLPILSCSIFIMLSAGNFQVSAYSLIVSVIYFTVRVLNLRNKNSQLKTIITGLTFIFLGITLASIQLFPTFELFINSVRGLENNLVLYNYGLISLRNIITFFAPDFFGNPVTGNSWAPIYHETTGYFGILTIPFLISAFFNKKNNLFWLFASIFFASLLLIFDTPIGRIVYTLNVPLFSTSYASRALFLTDFSAAVLASLGLEKLKTNPKTVLRLILLVTVFMILVIVSVFIIIYLSSHGVCFSKDLIGHLSISLKNLVLPTALTITLSVIFIVGGKSSIIYAGIIFLTLFDLFRFGLKYNTFTPVRLLYPTTPVIDFLTKNISYYRIDREKANILPPNTWMPYELMSASGYDPLYAKSYADYYSVYNSTAPGSLYSRYLELDNYNSIFLDLAGVKYLVVAKRDEKGVIVDYGGESISYKISLTKYKKVFEDRITAVLENTTVMPRALLFNTFDIQKDNFAALTSIYSGYDFRNKVIVSKAPSLTIGGSSTSDNIQIVNYLPNTVELKSTSKNNSIAVLTDAYYPGWKVYIDEKPVDILIADGIFRGVAVPAGTHQIKFVFEPKSFNLGLIISTGSLIVILFLYAIMRMSLPTDKNNTI